MAPFFVAGESPFLPSNLLIHRRGVKVDRNLKHEERGEEEKEEEEEGKKSDGQGYATTGFDGASWLAH